MAKLKSANIGDVHINAKGLPLTQLIEEIEGVFVSFVVQNRPDYIVINGDLFHNEIRTNSDACAYVLSLVYRLACLKSHQGNTVQLFIVDGTQSHDMFQNKMFTFLVDSPLHNVKIIYTAEVVEFMGEKLLFLPDEYVADPEAHFGPFINVPPNTYAHIYMHGVCDNFGAVIIGDQMDKINKEMHRFLFPFEQMCSIAKYGCIDNHYHRYTVMPSSNGNGQVIVVGSFARWVHGEEEAKGFLSSTIDYDSNSCTNRFVENHKASIYLTRDIRDFMNTESQLSDIGSEVELFMQRNQVKSLRLFVPFELTDNETVRAASDIFANKGVVFKYEKGGSDRTKDKDDDKTSSINSFVGVVANCTDIHTNIARFIEYDDNGASVTDDVMTPSTDKVGWVKSVLFNL